MERTVPLSNLTRFAQVVGRPESGMNLAEAALLIAQDAYPGLDTDAYLRRIDELSEPLMDRIRPDSSLVEMVDALNGHLFGDLGFRGNAQDYYDPRNSYLNEVLDRRLGIPITLSLLYMEVARRLGLTVVGVGLPGHFIVEARQGTSSLLLDPFAGGQVLNLEDCERLVQHVYGDSVEFSEDLLAPVRKRQILTRMLNNLKRNYLTADDPLRAWPVVEKMVFLDPENAVDRRDRGLLAHRLNQFGLARSDLRFYLERRPDAPDRVAIQASLSAIEAILQMMA
jgi:regulator of sirC expression with transglutaminase-like and TPR domain